MPYNPAGGQTYTLQSSIGSTDTSILLSSFLEPVTATPYTMALLNTDIVYATIAPKTTSSEFISFTGITQNADGTATLTGVVRGLAKKSPFTGSAAYRLPHSGQSQFILSDAPQVFKKFGTLDNDEVITGLWEAPDPTSPQGLVTNAYMLALINGGAISFNQMIESGTAGATIAAGNLIYFSETDNEWLLCDADTTTTIFNVKLGIAMGAGTNGNAITGGVLTRGSYTSSGLTQGDILYASNTAGGISSTVGTNPRVIGIARNTTVIYFDPDFQNLLHNYAVDSVGTDAYAVTLSAAFNAYYLGMEINFRAGTANTGPATLAVNGLAAKALVKNGSTALVTGDILANQIITAVYDGTSFQMQTASSNIPSGINPVINKYTVNSVIGSATTRFDITNPAGTTFRYTWDGTGTDPVINSGTFPIGTVVDLQGSAFAAGNKGIFTTTGVGTDWIEITNASGVAENDKVIGTGFITKGGLWTKPAGLKYISVEVQGGGGATVGTTTVATNSGAGAGGGGYSKKFVITAASLGATEMYAVGNGAPAENVGQGGRSIFGASLVIIGNGGISNSAAAVRGTGGTASGGDLNVRGGDGLSTPGSGIQISTPGGASVLGQTSIADVSAGADFNGTPGYDYGAGASGWSTNGAGTVTGAAGGDGVIIVTEYY